MAEKKKIYLIKIVDCEPKPGCQEEWFAYDKGAFTSEEVAKQVVNGIEFFKEVGDTTKARVVPFKISECETFSDWMDESAPWRQKE